MVKGNATNLQELIEKQDIKIHPSQYFEYTFDEDLFKACLDLTYTAKYRLEQPGTSTSTSLNTIRRLDTASWKEMTTTTRYWMKFDAENRQFYGTPDKSDSSKIDIKIIAYDGFDSLEETFNLTITSHVPYANNSL